jgi:hypothetical protein
MLLSFLKVQTFTIVMKQNGSSLPPQNLPLVRTLKPNEFIHILTHCCFLQYTAVFYFTPWPNIPSDAPFSYNTFQCYTAFHGSNIPRSFQTKTLTPMNTTKCLAQLNITTATEDEVHNHKSPHYKVLYIILSVHFS